MTTPQPAQTAPPTITVCSEAGVVFDLWPAAGWAAARPNGSTKMASKSGEE